MMKAASLSHFLCIRFTSLAPVAQSVENGEASTRVPGSNPGRTLCEIFLSLLG